MLITITYIWLSGFPYLMAPQGRPFSPFLTLACQFDSTNLTKIKVIYHTLEHNSKDNELVYPP